MSRSERSQRRAPSLAALELRRLPLTQVEIAEALGISRQALGALLAGRSSPSPRTIAAAREAFGTSPGAWFEVADVDRMTSAAFHIASRDGASSEHG